MAESAHGVAPDGMKKRDEDSDDGMEFSPFWGIEKGAVLQEARCFNESQLDARRCQQVITKLLYLLNQGETFTKVRARRDDRDERRRTRASNPPQRARTRTDGSPRASSLAASQRRLLRAVSSESSLERRTRESFTMARLAPRPPPRRNR